MKPRSLWRWCFRGRIPSVLGLRPTATSSVSASTSSRLPLASTAQKRTPFSVCWMLPPWRPSPPNTGLSEDALQFLRDLLVFDGNQPRQHFDNRDLGPEAVEDRRELHAHRARADDRHRFRNAGPFQDFDVCQNGCGVRLETGQHARFRTRGNDNVFGFECLRFAAFAHFHLAAALECGKAVNGVDLVLLHQEFDALGVLAHNFALAVEDARIIDARVIAVKSLLFRMREVLPHIGGVQERLGGDAADVEAGAPELVVFFDNGRFEAVLPGADRGGVAAGTASDHDEIVCHFNLRIPVAHQHL